MIKVLFDSKNTSEITISDGFINSELELDPIRESVYHYSDFNINSEYSDKENVFNYLGPALISSNKFIKSSINFKSFVGFP